MAKLHTTMRLLLLLPLALTACQTSGDFDPLGRALGTSDDESPAQEIDRDALDLVAELFLPVALEAPTGRQLELGYPGPAEPTDAPDDPEEPEEPAPTAEPAPAGDCDLSAEFVEPFDGDLPGGQPTGFSVEFVNLGDGLCFDNGVELLRFRGSTGAGNPELVGDLDFLPELAPGERVTLSWTDQETPRTGTHQYRVRYELPQEDADNGNHDPQKIVRYVWEGGGSIPVPPPSNPRPGPCDLSAEFTAPGGDALPGGQSVTWRVRFENEGGETCEGNTIGLERFTGGTATGAASRIGGSGGLEQLPDLRSGQSTTLSWVENSPPQSGTYTYKIRYSSPHNDDDNSNHLPVKTVTYGGGNNPNACDLEASFTSPNGANLPGGQSETWRVRLRNRGSATCPGGSLRLQRRQGNGPASLFGIGDFPGVAPGQSRDIQWTRTAPQSGTYTYLVQYAPDYEDANASNHHPTKTVTYVQGGGGGGQGACDLEASFQGPGGNVLQGGQSYRWELRLRNRGDGRCEGDTLKLYRYEGRSANGPRELLGQTSFGDLSPGASQEYGWTKTSSSAGGVYTYEVDYGSTYRDANNGNHHPTRTVRFRAEGCDLGVEITSPSNDRQNADRQQTWRVEVTNLGNRQCQDGSLRLVHYKGSDTRGNSTLVGLGEFPRLNPDQSRTISWTRQAPGDGTYTYLVQLDDYRDANNGNDRDARGYRFD